MQVYFFQKKLIFFGLHVAIQQRFLMGILKNFGIEFDLRFLFISSRAEAKECPDCPAPTHNDAVLGSGGHQRVHFKMFNKRKHEKRTSQLPARAYLCL